MAIKIKLNTEGIKQLDDIQKQFFNNVVDKIVEEAKLRAPFKTGALQESIEIKDKLDKQAKIGSDLPYALYQELGTRFQSGKPYLRPAQDYVLNHLEDI